MPRSGASICATRPTERCDALSQTPIQWACFEVGGPDQGRATSERTPHALVQQDPFDTINASAAEQNHEVRRAAAAGIRQCAVEHDRLVHISWVRRGIDSNLVRQAPNALGAYFISLQRKGVREKIEGRYLPKGDQHSGNRTKPAPVYRLGQAVPHELAPSCPSTFTPPGDPVRNRRQQEPATAGRLRSPATQADFHDKTPHPCRVRSFVVQ